MLEADAAHVDVQTPLLRGDGVVVGGLAGAYDLDEEGDDVEDDEEAGQALRFDMPDRDVGEQEVHDASQGHVRERVDPEWGEEDEELGDEGWAALVLHGHRYDSGYETAGFPYGAHDEHPAVRFAVEEGLSDMGEGDSTEDNGKKDCRTEGWTICPLGVGVAGVITLVTHDGCCRVMATALKRKGKW